MKQRFQFDKRMIRMIRTIFVMVVLLVLLGILLYVQVTDLLDVYMEEQGKEQVETLAEITERQFENELNALFVVAGEMAYIEGMRGDALRAIQDAHRDGRIGVLRLNGEAFFGEVYGIEDFPCIERAIHGESAISYREGTGLMFCVPAFRDKNVMYVVYRLYTENILYDHFGVNSYGGEGRVRINDMEDNVIVPATAPGSGEVLLYDEPDVANGFTELNSMLYSSGSAVRFTKTSGGNMMLYAAEVHNTDFHLAGYVSKSVVMEGVKYIGMLVLLVFAVLAGMVFFGGVLLMNLERRVKESDRLREEAQVAEHANAAKSEFLANMSHEIRTPINAVLGMNEMILREGMQGSETYAGTPDADTFDRIAGYAHNVDSAGKNLLAIINDILDFSKIESGKMELVPGAYKLSSVLNDVCNMVIFRAQAKDLGFESDVEETIPDELFGDEVRVRQIITNLLNNAVKYTKAGKITLKVRAQKILPATLEKTNLIISVIDTGIGIKKGDVDKLFTKFGRVDLDKNKTIEGTGLGLAITGSLLDMMGGDINVESEYGKGSVFTATIPQKIVSETPIGSFREKADSAFRQQKVYHESFHAPDARILVVDDTEINLTVFKGLIADTQVKVNTATSGDQALEMTKDIPFDLIYMDQRMPGMDGTQTLHAIREQADGVNGETPVICLTADVVQGARERYLSEGFTDYLSKPVEGKALEQSLAKYLPQEKVVREEASPGETLRERSDGQGGEAPRDGNGPAEASSLRTLYDGIDMLHYDDAIKLLATDDLIDRTLRQFYEESAYKADEIERMLAEEDYENYTIKVHALKSSARMIGANALSELAKELEDLGNTAKMQ